MHRTSFFQPVRLLTSKCDPFRSGLTLSFRPMEMLGTFCALVHQPLQHLLPIGFVSDQRGHESFQDFASSVLIHYLVDRSQRKAEDGADCLVHIRSWKHQLRT